MQGKGEYNYLCNKVKAHNEKVNNARETNPGGCTAVLAGNNLH